MKKIITAVIVAVSAFMLNAASIDWSFSQMAMNTKNPTDISSFTAYLFDASTWTTALGSQDGITKDTFASSLDSAALNYASLANGNVSQWQTGTQAWTDDAAASGNYYVVISDGSVYAASESLAATAYNSAQEAHTAASWAITGTQTPLGSSSFTAVVPEPTSSLLMLVGLAGLALRRRRA